MPYSVAKKIAQDLVVGDSAQELLSAVVEQLELTENKVVLKDSIIDNLRNKEFNLMDQVRNEKMAKEAYITMYNNLEGEYTRVYKQYKKQKFVNRIYKVGFWTGCENGSSEFHGLTAKRNWKSIATITPSHVAVSVSAFGSIRSEQLQARAHADHQPTCCMSMNSEKLTKPPGRQSLRLPEPDPMPKCFGHLMLGT